MTQVNNRLHDALDFFAPLTISKKTLDTTNRKCQDDRIPPVPRLAAMPGARFSLRPVLTANPQHTLGLSWSVRLSAAPQSVGNSIFVGSPPTRNTLLVHPGVSGSRPRFPGLTANPQPTAAMSPEISTDSRTHPQAHRTCTDSQKKQSPTILRSPRCWRWLSQTRVARPACSSWTRRRRHQI